MLPPTDFSAQIRATIAQSGVFLALIGESEWRRASRKLRRFVTHRDSLHPSARRERMVRERKSHSRDELLVARLDRPCPGPKQYEKGQRQLD
jgi:hypothetical protein